MNGPIDDDPDDETGDPGQDTPRQDIVLDLEAEVVCPHCGETVVMGLDPGSGSEQEYVEDCPVCCHPWQVRVRYDDTGVAVVRVDQA